MTGFYAPQVRRQLAEMLRTAAKEPDFHDPIFEETLRAACPPFIEADAPDLQQLYYKQLCRLHNRLLYELDCEAREVVTSFERLSGGRLNKQLKALRKIVALNGAIADLESFIENTNPAPDEFDADLLRLLRRFRGGLSVYRLSGHAPREIKSAGKNSQNIARQLLKDFLIAASVIWHQGTAESPRPNKSGDGESRPVGNYSKFISTAVQPIVEAINKRGRVVPDKWRTYYDVLERALDIRTEELLGADPVRMQRKRRRSSPLPK